MFQCSFRPQSTHRSPEVAPARVTPAQRRSLVRTPKRIKVRVCLGVSTCFSRHYHLRMRVRRLSDLPVALPSPLRLTVNNTCVKPFVEGTPSIMALWDTTRVTWCLGFTRRFAVRVLVSSVAMTFSALTVSMVGLQLNCETLETECDTSTDERMQTPYNTLAPRDHFC